MRYREGVAPDPSTPYGESMHAMLSLSAVLGIVIGIVLYLIARRGRSLWLTCWSVGLALSGCAYLVADTLGLSIARI